jgi:hypothetical protein
MNEIVSEDERSALAHVSGSLNDLLESSQLLKNQERSLGVRRRSSRSEVQVYFQVKKWCWGKLPQYHETSITTHGYGYDRLLPAAYG